MGLLDDLVSGAALARPGALALGPSPDARVWMRQGEAPQLQASPLPPPVWEALGVPGSCDLDGSLLDASWAFLLQLHLSPGLEAGPVASPGTAASPTKGWRTAAGGSETAGPQIVSHAEDGSVHFADLALQPLPSGMAPQQCQQHLEHRSLRLVHRLLLAGLHTGPAEAAAAASAAAATMPLLLSESVPSLATDGSGSSAAAAGGFVEGRMQLLLASLARAHAQFASAGPAYAEHATLVAANSLVAARTAAAVHQLQTRRALPGQEPLQGPGLRRASLGPLPQPPPQQRQELQAANASIQELERLIDLRLVASAAIQELQFQAHAAAYHGAAAEGLAAAARAVEAHRQQRGAAAIESSLAVLRLVAGADRQRRAGARQGEEEAQQAAARQWRDVARSLAAGRSLWAGPDEAPESEGQCRQSRTVASCDRLVL